MDQKREVMTEKYRKDNQPYDIDIIQPSTVLTKAAKAINLGILFAFITIALGMSVLLCWSLASDKVLDVRNDPFPVRVIDNHTDANDVIILSVDLCKTSDIRGTLRTSFINNNKEIFLPEIKESLAEGCFVREIPVIIPDGLQAGMYKIKFVTTYDINPIKKNVVNEFDSQEFLVNPTR